MSLDLQHTPSADHHHLVNQANLGRSRSELGDEHNLLDRCKVNVPGKAVRSESWHLNLIPVADGLQLLLKIGLSIVGSLGIQLQKQTLVVQLLYLAGHGRRGVVPEFVQVV